MRIAYFTDTFVPQVNGVVTSILTFARELGERGHEVVIFAPRTRGLKQEPWSAPNVRVVRLPSVPALVYPDIRFAFSGMTKVLAQLRAFDPDLIHFHTPLSVGVFAIVASRILRKPLVGTNHIYLTRNNVEFLRCITGNARLRKNMGRVILPLGRLFYESCDVRLTPSRDLIRELRRDGYARKITYLPNAVRLPPEGEMPAHRRQELHASYGVRDRVVVHVGRFSKEKHVEVVLEAFALLSKRMDDVSLLMIGDGPLRGGLEKMAHRHGIRDRVVFTGFVPHARLMGSGVLGACDLFATASTMESQGMVILEAMAFGLPIVAVREAAVAEVVGGAGHLVDPGDAPAMAHKMEQVLRSEAQTQRLRKQARKQAEQYSVHTVTDHLLDAYRDAVGRHHHHRSKKRTR